MHAVGRTKAVKAPRSVCKTPKRAATLQHSSRSLHTKHATSKAKSNLAIKATTLSTIPHTLSSSVRHFSSPASTETEFRQELMTHLITKALQPTYLHILDTSGGCGAFYQLTVVSSQFEGLLPVRRHRLVQTAIAEVTPHIHGFNIQSFTPQQWETQRATAAAAQTQAV